jgi:hypothetical protein
VDSYEQRAAVRARSIDMTAAQFTRSPTAIGVLIGACLTFGVLAILSIGFPFLLLGLGLAGWQLFAPRRRDSAVGWGVLLGVGIVLLGIGLTHLGDHPCASSRATVHLAPAQTGPVGCGGDHPLPWLVVGGATAALGLLGARLMRDRSRRVAHSERAGIRSAGSS